MTFRNLRSFQHNHCLSRRGAMRFARWIHFEDRRWRQQVSPKHWYQFIKLHDGTSHNLDTHRNDDLTSDSSHCRIFLSKMWKQTWRYKPFLSLEQACHENKFKVTHLPFLGIVYTVLYVLYYFLCYVIEYLLYHTQ